jgi:hypothetical protein
MTLRADDRGQGLRRGDAILRAAIRGQVGSIVKRLHREGTIENIGAAAQGSGSLWAGPMKIAVIPLRFSRLRLRHPITVHALHTNSRNFQAISGNVLSLWPQDGACARRRGCPIS